MLTATTPSSFRLNTHKKLVKKLAKKASYFLASEALDQADPAFARTRSLYGRVKSPRSG
jgi:hypothetical protein